MNHTVSELEPYDPRSIANAIILIYKARRAPVTNLALQKLLYFCHARYLSSTGRPLIQGYFEAWTHGPVHPAVYGCFRDQGAEPLQKLAERKDLRTGELTVVTPPSRPEINALIQQVVGSLGRLTAGQLVTLSHARDGPWDVIYRKTKSQPVLGLRISNDLIRERAKFHKVSSDHLENVREPDEDTPLTNYGFG